MSGARPAAVVSFRLGAGFHRLVLDGGSSRNVGCNPLLQLPMFPRCMSRESCFLVRPAFWLVVAGVTTFILAKSWLRWMDPQIDLGLQLYLPWRITLGEHLGRDYLHPYGSLSTYFNAGLFAVFGPGVRTLVLANLVIYAAIVVVLYKVLRAGFGLAGAALATLTGIIIFGFGNYTDVPNYTYAAPYTHEATHGMALLLVLVALLIREQAGTRGHGWLVGGVFGLVLLTKVEVAFAAGLVTAAAGGLHLVRDGGRAALSWCGRYAGGALGVLLLAWLLLAWATDGANAAKVVGAGFLGPLLFSAFSFEPHNAAIMGLDDLTGNLELVALVGGLATAYVAALTGMARCAAAARSRAAQAALAAGALLLFAGAFPFLRDFSVRTGRAFPLLMLSAGVVVGFRVVRELRARRTLGGRTLAQALLWVAAIGMMTRVMLAPKVYHYGFYLTMLAGVWLTAFLTAEWPRVALPRSRWRLVLGVELALTIGIVAGFLLSLSLARYAQKNYPIGEGADRIYGVNPAIMDGPAVIENARRYLVAHTEKDATVLVMPEGISLNYWARRKCPLRICDTLPPALKSYGRSILGDLQANPPDCVVLMSRMGPDVFPPFGSTPEAGQEVLPWLAANYLVVAQAGGDPLVRFNGKNFGVRILKKNIPAVAK